MRPVGFASGQCHLQPWNRRRIEVDRQRAKVESHFVQAIGDIPEQELPVLRRFNRSDGLEPQRDAGDRGPPDPAGRSRSSPRTPAL